MELKKGSQQVSQNLEWYDLINAVCYDLPI